MDLWIFVNLSFVADHFLYSHDLISDSGGLL